MTIREAIRQIMESLAGAIKASSQIYAESLPESILARRARDEDILKAKIRIIIERRMCFDYLNTGSCDHDPCPELDEVRKEIL